MKWPRWFWTQKNKNAPQSHVEEVVEGQIRNVEAVFGVARWTISTAYIPIEYRGDGRDDSVITCLFHKSSGVLDMIGVRLIDDDHDEGCYYFPESQEPLVYEPENYACRQIMARGLFCLGFDDPDVLSEFDPSFTAHEKLELRLSLPREFWPQKWLQEVDDGT